MQRLASGCGTTAYGSVRLPSGKTLEVKGFGREHALWVDLLQPDASRHCVATLSHDEDHPVLSSHLVEGLGAYHAVDVVFEIEGRHYHVHSNGRMHALSVRIVA